MKKLVLLGLLTVIAFSVLVGAGNHKVTADALPSKGHATVSIPAHAAEVAPGIFSLGNAVHEGQMVQGYAFVHYKDAKAKPSGCNNDGVCQGWESASCGDCGGGGEEPPPSDTSCYGFISKRTMWKSVEPYVVNPANTVGLNETFIIENFAMDIAKWEAAASTDILGEGSVTAAPLEADSVSPDGVNEVYFGSIDDSGAIAITIVWGTFNAPPPKRELLEWDQVYDQVDYGWSATGEAGKMDFESLATHELGHSVGMGDLYTDECGEQTMYGYASYGETNKRTLEAGDIAGVQELY
jgi:hypothetical protein